MIRRTLQIPYQGLWDDILTKSKKVGLNPSDYLLRLHKANNIALDIPNDDRPSDIVTAMSKEYDEDIAREVALIPKITKSYKPNAVCAGCGERNRDCRC